MMKNKHVAVAMIVAPMLAIISYFATDYAISDEPIVAKDGESYALLARPNCRYESGECTLKNGDIELNLRLVFEASTGQVLVAKSNQPLTGVKVALVSAGEDERPVSLTPMGSDKTAWMMPLNGGVLPPEGIQLAFEHSGKVFYASTATTFFDYDTIFPRDEW